MPTWRHEGTRSPTPCTAKHRLMRSVGRSLRGGSCPEGRFTSGLVRWERCLPSDDRPKRLHQANAAATGTGCGMRPSGHASRSAERLPAARFLLGTTQGVEARASGFGAWGPESSYGVSPQPVTESPLPPQSRCPPPPTRMTPGSRPCPPRPTVLRDRRKQASIVLGRLDSMRAMSRSPW